MNLNISKYAINMVSLHVGFQNQRGREGWVTNNVQNNMAPFRQCWEREYIVLCSLQIV